MAAEFARSATTAGSSTGDGSCFAAPVCVPYREHA